MRVRVRVRARVRVGARVRMRVRVRVRVRVTVEAWGDVGARLPLGELVGRERPVSVAVSEGRARPAVQEAAWARVRGER